MKKLVAGGLLLLRTWHLTLHSRQAALRQRPEKGDEKPINRTIKDIADRWRLAG